MKWIGRTAEGLVGVVFFWAGFLKLLDPQAFVSSILTYEVFSYQVAVVCALVVPYLEIVTGVCLVLGVLKSGSRLMASGMLVVFILLLAEASIRGLDADCGCFGERSGTESGYAWPIARDALMLLGLAVGLVFERLTRDTETE